MGAAYPANGMVPANLKANRQALLTLSWAAAAGLPLLFRLYVSSATLCLWVLASVAVFASLGNLSKSQDGVSKLVDGGGDSDEFPAGASQAPASPPLCDPPRCAASCRFSLVAHTSPDRAPPPTTAAATAVQRVACADAATAPSPASVLVASATAMAAPSAETSRTVSAVNSGQSAAVAPSSAVVDSVLAVAALRRSNTRYRSPYTAAAAPTRITAGGGACASGGAADAANGATGDVGRRSVRTQLHVKIPHLDPRDLRPDLVAAVNNSLWAHDTGMMVVGAYLRRGCVELTLDIVQCAAAATGSRTGALTPAATAALRHLSGAADSGGSAGPDALALSTLLLAALHVPPPPTAVVATGGSGGTPCAVVFQRCDARWSMMWDADAERWQPCERVSDGGGDGSGVRLSAPLAVHAAQQLAPGAAAGCGTLRLAVDLRREVVVGVAAAIDPVAEAMTIVAKANGRTVAVPLVSPPSAAAASVAPASTVTVVLEVDVARLAAGRPESSPGLVVRLELWRSSDAGVGAVLLDFASVACLADERAVSELLVAQRELTAAGALDPEDEAYVPPEQQRAEAAQLLGDLATWLDYAAACSTADVAAAAAEPLAPLRGGGGGDCLDLSEQVATTLLRAGLQRMMLGAGRHLLSYFVFQGFVALAGAVQADLAPRVAAAAAAGVSGSDGGEEEGEDAGMPLLHRAVRSGQRDMVELVLEWAAAGGGSGGGGAAAEVWAARGAGGVTALHLLAADARCGGGGAGAAVVPAAEREAAEASPAAVEALLRWILASWPAAVTVWNTARDASGNTPAMLWSALGGQEMQVVAAAAALEQEVAAIADVGLRFRGRGVGAIGNADVGSARRRNGIEPLQPAAPPHAVLPPPAVGLSAPPPAVAVQDATAERQLPQEPSPSPPSQSPSSASPAPGFLQLLRLSLVGFACPAIEQEYLSYVTRTTAPLVLIWLVIMVVAHVTAFFKSPDSGEGRQALIGGFAYVVSLVVMALRPRAYASSRERLMLACLLGRTTCRLALTVLPDFFHMAESVQKYVWYGIDVLLDGFMEGTFEPVRVRQALVARLALEWPIMAAFFCSLGVRQSYDAALLRAAAVSFAGAAMSAVTDVRSRAMFLREKRRALVAADASGSGDGEKQKRG